MVSTANWKSWYSLDSDGTDATGNGYTLTNVGTVTFSTPAKIGNAALLGSTNSTKSLVNTSTTPFGMTLTNIKSGSWGISGWFYVERTGVDQILWKYQITNGSRLLNFNVIQSGSNNHIYYQTYDGSGTFVDSGVTVSTSNWYHITFSYDGTTLRGCINGVVRYSAAKTFADAAGSTGSVRLGAEAVTAASWWSGNIDMWGFRAAALSDGGGAVNSTATGDVADLYNAGNGLNYPFVSANTSSMFQLF